MLYVRAVDGDGFPDLMVVDANGNLRSNAPAPATITQIVSAGDATGDGKTDLVYRTDVSARLLLRTGIKDPTTGGVKLDSLAAAVNSEGGAGTVVITNTDGVGWKTKMTMG